jgi:hypothetical protein
MLDNDLMLMRLLVTQNLREVQYATYEGIEILYTAQVDADKATLTLIDYDDDGQQNPVHNHRARMSTTIVERCADFVANATILNQMLCQLKLISPNDSTEGVTLQEHSLNVKEIQSLFYTGNTITESVFKTSFLEFPISPPVNQLPVNKKINQLSGYVYPVPQVTVNPPVTISPEVLANLANLFPNGIGVLE